MTNPCNIDARKDNETNMENDAHMGPKWRPESIKNIWKNYTKKHHENWCKNEAPKSSWPKGPQAQSAGRVKEFLRRLEVKVPSCIQRRQKNKHLANN